MDNNSPVKFVYISRADYDGLAVKDNSTLYFVTDTGGNSIYVGNVLFTPVSGAATDNSYGTVKLNSSESINVNSEGQLDVGGRLGQFSSTTGVYSPKSIEPQMVGNGSFLLTEASGIKLGNKSMAVTTGSGLTLKTSAAAGSTEYRVNNTYENRIICAGCVGGILALNESSAPTSYANILSVTINGASFTPSSTDSSGDIIIKTDRTVNPNGATTSVRPYANQGYTNGFSNMFVGQQIGGNGGASILVGQKVFSASGNADAMIGASMYNTGNGNAMFGRQHISRKNRCLLAGTGHDTTNARSESVSAVGEWSDLNSTEILFAVGDGTSATDRSNAFEVRDQAIVLKSPGGTKYKVTVDNSGNLTTSPIT